ncbi:bacteriophage abortive infection AbiH family protein [Dyadobacter sp. CY261]|uniref:AbiH family protein n=1 Tax=Dyadobacter sp. CY261 TaxID=2907203 RepID=UPI001F3D4CEF|nr:AbiH family protein [Dyadobacter sp. CY261]MCF0072203.1 bacteriophage abortive infection AbiH family protein [Dyadobacter sp. CY261]
MNRIVILGNGFDIAHGLLTGYRDFIKYLRNEFVDFVNACSHEQISKLHPLFYFTSAEAILINGTEPQFFAFKHNEEVIKSWEELCARVSIRYNGNDVCNAQVSFRNLLLGYVFTSSSSTTWGGFENDYKDVLTRIMQGKPNSANGIIPKNYTAKNLNDDLKQIVELLYRYLKDQITIPKTLDKKILSKLLSKPIRKSRMDSKHVPRYGEISIINHHEEPDNLENVLFLSFNYTATIQNYLFKSENFNAIDNCNLDYNSSNRITTSLRYIHGDLDDGSSDSLIFGYGDELDESQAILERSGDEFLKHIKSVLYTRSPYYREVIDFADAGHFDIVIYGHSCSNTDRTLLNALFEHENCISIQPYLYDLSDTSIYMNIYRCFKDKQLMRRRVVDQTSTIRG